MSRSRMLLGVVAAMVSLPAVGVTRLLAQQGAVEPVQVEKVAEQLGVKLHINSPRDLDLGKSVTATLERPKQLAEHGIKSMHEGARVTITCVGPGRVRVEADEMEPVEQKEAVVLKVEAGVLGKTPEPRAPAKPPTA